VRDPHEALRQDAEREAKDELVDVEAQDLLLAAVRGAPVAEGDATPLEARDARVGERHAMDAGTE
jgi:hypothetical protein